MSKEILLSVQPKWCEKKTGIYTNSNIRKYLNSKFWGKLAKEVGAENIIEHIVDLTSDEGNKKHGSVVDKVSLLTCELFRKYNEILEKYNPRRWWWLATPYAIEYWKDCARAVSLIGMLSYGSFSRVGGVRPFCILKSNIFVSKVEE